MRRALLSTASGLGIATIISLSMPAMALDQRWVDQEGQAACDGKIFFGNHQRTDVMPPNFRMDQIPRLQAQADAECNRWRVAKAKEDERKQKQAAEAAAKEQAQADYVPSYEDTNLEWHIITQNVHADVLVLKYWTTYLSTMSNSIPIQNNWPVPSRVNVTEGSIFSIPPGTFDPHSIEMKVRLWGLTGVFVSPNDTSISPPNATIPTAAADPNPLECQVDTKSSDVLDKTLLRCRPAGSEEWTLSNR